MRKHLPPRSNICGGPAMGEQGTWLEPECDGERRARVLFPDGLLRVVRCSGVADSFYSISCRGRHARLGYVGNTDGTFVFVPFTRCEDN